MPRGKTIETGHAVVYPTGERDMPGVPAVPLVTDDATAARLITSGAFRYEAPAVAEGEPTPEIEVIELTDEHRAALDTFVPVPPVDPAPEE